MAIVPGQSYPITVTRSTGTPGYNGPWRPQNADRRTIVGQTPVAAVLTRRTSGGSIDPSREADFVVLSGSDANTSAALQLLNSTLPGYPVYVRFTGGREYVWFSTSYTAVSSATNQPAGVRVGFEFGGVAVDMASIRDQVSSASIAQQRPVDEIYAITSPGRTDSDGTVQAQLPGGLGDSNTNINIPPVTGEDMISHGVALVDSRDFTSQVTDTLGRVIIQGQDALTLEAQKASVLLPGDTTDDQLLSATVTIDEQVYTMNQISYGSDDSLLMEVVKTLDPV